MPLKIDAQSMQQDAPNTAIPPTPGHNHKDHTVNTVTGDQTDTPFHRITIIAQILAICWTAYVASAISGSSTKVTYQLTFSSAFEFLLTAATIILFMSLPFIYTLIAAKSTLKDDLDRKTLYISLIFNSIYIITAASNLYFLLGKNEQIDMLQWCVLQCSAAAILGTIYLLMARAEPRRA